jgi:hypothetical protein
MKGSPKTFFLISPFPIASFKSFLYICNKNMQIKIAAEAVIKKGGTMKYTMNSGTRTRMINKIIRRMDDLYDELSDDLEKDDEAHEWLEEVFQFKLKEEAEKVKTRI